MPPSRYEPPWEYLRTASMNTLQTFELSRLNHAANIRKEMFVMVDQWLEESVCAMVARWLLDHRQVLPPESTSAPMPSLEAHPASYNVFARLSLPPPGSAPSAAGPPGAVP
jgi:hypothetical protein